MIIGSIHRCVDVVTVVVMCHHRRHVDAFRIDHGNHVRIRTSRDHRCGSGGLFGGGVGSGGGGGGYRWVWSTTTMWMWVVVVVVVEEYSILVTSMLC